MPIATHHYPSFPILQRKNNARIAGPSIRAKRMRNRKHLMLGERRLRHQAAKTQNFGHMTAEMGRWVRSPPPLPTSSFLTVSCRFVRELKGALSSRYLRWQHQTNHFAVCFSQSGGNRVRVDIHRGANIRVSQQLLLNPKIHTERV